MDIEQDFAKLWFTHECTLLRGAGASPYGGSMGEPVEFKGRVSQSTQRVDSPNGQELVTDTVVRCPLALEVEVGDHITLPEPFEGTWVITQRSAHDGVGDMHPNHQKLTLTEAADTDAGGGGIYG